jgi:hypothetical protein
MADVFDGIELTPEQKAELATLRRGYFLLDKLMTDPAHGTSTKRALKAVDPSLNIVVPEDVAEPLIAPIKQEIDALKTSHAETLAAIDEKKTAIEQVVENFNKTRQDEKEVTDLQGKIDAAARKYRFTDEGKAALIEHMRATNTSDPDTAGAYLVQHMERPAPTAATGIAPEMARRNGAPDVDLFQLATGQTNDDLKLLHGTPKEQERWMTNEINKVIAETMEAA